MMLLRALVISSCALALMGCSAHMDRSNGLAIYTSAAERELAFLARHPSLASRTGKSLVLTLSDGRVVRLIDKGEEECENPATEETAECYISYKAVHYYSYSKTFLLDVAFYEGGGAMLVNARGDGEFILGLPKFSPSGNRFAAFEDDCSHYGPVSVQIMDLRRGEFLEAFLDTVEDGAGFSGVVWESEHRLRLSLYDCRDFYPETAQWTAFLQKDASGNWNWENKMGPMPRPQDSDED